MKILFLSDTHEFHRQLTNLPSADMIIHAGDITNRGKVEKVEDFIHWFTSLDYKYKIFIAGNHDFYFESKCTSVIQKILPTNTFYLCDNGIKIEGINIYGSPVTPIYLNLAFNQDRNIIKKHWELIPFGTDILITHGPPYGILDTKIDGEHLGCKVLLEFVNKLHPSYHLFGHIHESYGLHKIGYITYINGSLLNKEHKIENNPIIFEFNKNKIERLK
jgi:Icc-related predicted phosphoesterase